MSVGTSAKDLDLRKTELESLVVALNRPSTFKKFATYEYDT